VNLRAGEPTDPVVQNPAWRSPLLQHTRADAPAAASVSASCISHISQGSLRLVHSSNGQVTTNLCTTWEFSRWRI